MNLFVNHYGQIKGSEFDNRSMKPWIEKDRNEQNLKNQNLQVCNFNIKKCVY